MDITKVKLKKRRIDYSKDIIIHCQTKEDWKNVCKKIEAESNILWWGAYKPAKHGYFSWRREISYIEIMNNKLSSGSKKYYEEIYPHIPITSAKNFLCNIVKQPSIPTIDYSKNLIIHCPTKEDWENVCKKIEAESNILWWGTYKPTEHKCWDDKKESSCIIIENNQLGYGSKNFFGKHYSHTPITSTKNFLCNIVKQPSISIMDYSKTL